MKRMRRSAPWLIAAWLYVGGISLALYAADQSPVTRDEMQNFVYETIATAGIIVVGVAAGLLAWILARDRDINGKRMDQVAQGLSDIATNMNSAINRAIEALEKHNESPTAHANASEHNHGPMYEQMDKIESKLDDLIIEHRIIRDAEKCIAANRTRNETSV